MYRVMSIEALDILIGEGLDVNRRDRDGFPPIARAAKHSHGYIEAITALIARGADVRKPTRDGQTALGFLIAKGGPEANRGIRLILDAYSKLITDPVDLQIFQETANLHTIDHLMKNSYRASRHKWYNVFV